MIGTKPFRLVDELDARAVVKLLRIVAARPHTRISLLKASYALVCSRPHTHGAQVLGGLD